MRTDRISARAWLATVLVGGALLFFIGISIEQGATSPATPTAVTPSGESAASQPVEGGGSEAGEGATAKPEGSSAAVSGETTPEAATEWRPFGINLESPMPVGGAILVSVLLAVAVIRLTSPMVPVAVIGFALVFLVFDGLEVAHQVEVAKPILAVIATVLVVLHLAAALLAVRLIRASSPAPLAR